MTVLPVFVNPIIVIAMLSTTAAALPLLLCGGLVILMQPELGFDVADLGVGIAAYFGMSALVAVPAGRIADRIGPRTTTRAGLAIAVIALVGIGGVSGGWTMTVALLGLAGIGNALTQLGVNLLVVRGVASDRQGLAYGSKQAAIPLSSLLAGLALPIVGLSIGWRWAFIGASLVGLAMFRAIPRDAPRRRSPDGPPVADSRRASLVLLSIGVGLGAIGGNCAAAFIVLFLVSDGFDPASAGFLLASGSALGITSRVGFGWLADRIRRDALAIVGTLIAVGIAGFLILASNPGPPAVVLGTFIVFGAGWGFAGLVPLAVARANPGSPAAAMGIVQAGPMAASVAGPIAFGLLAAGVSYAAAWALMAGLAGVGLLFIVGSRRVANTARIRAG